MAETQPKDAFILIDHKLNAIIGTFSTLEKVLNAKKEAMKKDLNIIKKKITERMTLDVLNENDRTMLSGILNQIDYIKNDFNSRYDKVLIEYEGYSYTYRYLYYRMSMDTYNVDKSIYGPIIFLPYRSNTDNDMTTDLILL